MPARTQEVLPRFALNQGAGALSIAKLIGFRLNKNEPAKQDIKEKIDAAILEQEKPILASNAASIRADDVAGGEDQTDNKGIRNVGDVVNLIVNKVDKRKDKFIQFRTDDDDSSISAINIGPFKFGKKKK